MLDSILRMKDFADATVQMESNLGCLGHIEIMLELHEHVTNGVMESCEKMPKYSEALEPLVGVLESPRLKEKFPSYSCRWQNS